MFVHGIFALSSLCMMISFLIEGNPLRIIWGSAIVLYCMINFVKEL